MGRKQDYVVLQELVSRYEHMVEYPPLHKNIIWPVQFHCEKQYQEIYAHISLIFDEKEMEVIDLNHVIATPQATQYIKKIIELVSELNQDEYYYCAFSLTCLLRIEGKEVMLAFSELVGSKTVRNEKSNYPLGKVYERQYELAFVEPLFACGDWNVLDLYMQNFSMGVLFFILLFGHHPFKGKQWEMDEETLVFIFDPIDTQNQIGDYEREQKVIKRWMETNESIKDMFIALFSRENMKHRISPPLEAWRQCL